MLFLKYLAHEEILKSVMLFIIEEWRLRCDLLQTFKLLTGKENFVITIQGISEVTVCNYVTRNVTHYV